MTNSTNYSMVEVAGYMTLWLAIHGGDPAPDGTISEAQASAIAGRIIHTLSSYLVSGAATELADGDAEGGLARFGMKLTPYKGTKVHPHQCVDTGSGVICYPGGVPQPVRD